LGGKVGGKKREGQSRLRGEYKKRKSVTKKEGETFGSLSSGVGSNGEKVKTVITGRRVSRVQNEHGKV